MRDPGRSREEAKAYMQDPVLRARLIEIFEAVFRKVLEKYYAGEEDQLTEELPETGSAVSIVVLKSSK